MRRRAGDLFFAPWWKTSSRSLSYLSICRRCWFSRISSRFSSTRISSRPRSVRPFLPLVNILLRIDMLSLQRPQEDSREEKRLHARLPELRVGHDQRADLRDADIDGAAPEPAPRGRGGRDLTSKGVLRGPRVDRPVGGEERDGQGRLRAGLPRRQGGSGGRPLPRGLVRRVDQHAPVSPFGEAVDELLPQQLRVEASEAVEHRQHGDDRARRWVKGRVDLETVGPGTAAQRQGAEQDGRRNQSHSSNRISGGSLAGASVFFSRSFTGRASSFFSTVFSGSASGRSISRRISFSSSSGRAASGARAIPSASSLVLSRSSSSCFALMARSSMVFLSGSASLVSSRIVSREATCSLRTLSRLL